MTAPARPDRRARGGATLRKGPAHSTVLVLVPAIRLKQRVAEQMRVLSSWSPSSVDASETARSAPRDGPGRSRQGGRGAQAEPPHPFAQLITRACAKHLGTRPLD